MDINICTFTGRVGRDPEVRYAASGTAVCGFSVACGHKYKDTEHTEWVNCTAFGKLAEICGEYLQKGKQVAISGRMQTDQWEDKNGNKRYTTKIILEKMTMLGGGGQPRTRTTENDPGDENIPF